MKVEELLPAGRFVLRLLEGRSWLPRRVETVSIESIDRVRRSITLDVSTSALKKYCRETRFYGSPESGYLPVPLSLLSKSLFIDFDVRDGSGCAIALETSDQDSALAVGAALAALERAGYPTDSLSDDIVQRLIYIARHFPSESDGALISEGIKHLDVFKPDYSAPGIVAIDSVDQWRTIFNDYVDFADLMSTFTTQFLPTALLKLTQPTVIVKFGYTEALHKPKISIDQPQGRGSRQYAVTVPGIGTAGREHTRINVPDGLLIEGIRLGEEKGRLMAGNIEEIVSSKRYRVRLAPERASIYTSGLPLGRYFISLTLRAARPGFLRQGWLALTASLSMLWLGGLLNMFSDRLGHSAKEAVVVLLLVPPTAMIALLAREGELPVVSDVLRYARAFILLAAVSSVVAASCLAVGFHSQTIGLIWVFCGLAVAFCLRELIRTDSESRQAERSIRSPERARQLLLKGETRDERVVVCYWSPVFGDEGDPTTDGSNATTITA